MHRSIFPSLRRRLWKASLVAAAFSLLAVQVALAASGGLDPTFSGDGRVANSIITGQRSQAFDLVIQPNGAIIAAGESWASKSNANIALARYTTAGALDTSFNNTGRKVTDLGAIDYALGVDVDPTNGKVVVAGSKCRSAVGCNVAVVRYNSNGSLDTTFNGTGVRADDFGGGSNGGSPGVSIQSDGSILIAGYMFNPLTQNYNFAVYRYTNAGQPDSAFSGDGRQQIDFGSGRHDFASSLVVQPDGRILVAGESCDLSGGKCNFALARLSANGSLDTSFHSVGKLVTDFGGDDRAYGMALQPDGRIVLVGVKYTVSTSYFALARYTPGGLQDATFGVSGKKVIDFTGNAYPESARSVVIQPDGKIVVCGTAGSATNSNFALARFTSSGTLDLTFSGDGKVAVNLGYNEGCSALSLQSDGKYVLAGYTDNGSIRKFALARVLP
ncbi:MAG: delta-60 repeat domain-containing protein [Bacteroidota bacterium]